MESQLEASDLRIGNLLENFLGEAFECNIETLNSLIEGGNEFPPPKPIPLTEEWLLKFGFEWSIYHQANHKEGFRFDISEKHNDGYTLHLFKKKEIIVESFYFVHQLQNLYYALTQTELTINN